VGFSREQRRQYGGENGASSFELRASSFELRASSFELRASGDFFEE